ALLPAAAALQLAASPSPGLVARVYSRGVYRVAAAVLAATLGRWPFSVGEVLLWLAAAAFGAWTARLAARLWHGRGRRLGVVRGAVSEAWIAAGVVYLAFLLLWGLNYRRRPYAELAGLDVRPASVAELIAVCERLVGESNRARDGLPEDAGGVMRLAAGRAGALRRAPDGYREAARIQPALEGPSARAKPVLVSTALSYLGI